MLDTLLSRCLRLSQLARTRTQIELRHTPGEVESHRQEAHLESLTWEAFVVRRLYLGGIGLGLALAQVSLMPEAMAADYFPYQPPSPSVLNQLLSTPLTPADFQGFTCEHYYSLGNQFGYPQQSLCNFLSNQPGFWSTTQAYYYRITDCNNNGSVVVGNFLVASDPRYAYAGKFPLNSTVTSTVEPLCNNTVAPGFSYPPGYLTSSVSNRTISVIPVITWGYTSDISAADVSVFTSNFISYILYRTGDGSIPLSVNYTAGGSAQNGVDYSIQAVGQPNTPGLFTFPTNVNEVRYDFIVTPNSSNHPETTVDYTIAFPSGYYTINPVLTGRILALDKPGINITPVSGSSNTLTPGTINPGFTLSRVQGSPASLAKPLVVYYTLSGTASNGTDYAYLNGQTTIPANQQSVNVGISVPVQGGSQPIAAKDIQINLSTSQSNLYVAGSDTTETFTIPAYSPTTVSISATPTSLNRGDSTTLTLTRTAANGDYSQALPVTLSTGGTATSGSDYEPIPATLTIPANAQSTTLVMNTKIPTTNQPLEPLTISVASGANYTASSSAGSVQLVLAEYTLQYVSVSPATATAAAGTTTLVTFSRTQNEDRSAPITVNYTVSGSAQMGRDYSNPIATTGSVTIQSGQVTVSIPVIAVEQNGTTSKPDRSLVITMQPGTGYQLTPNGPSDKSTLTFPAYDPAALSITPSGGGIIQPGSNGGFTISRPATSDTRKDLIVNYVLSGNAVNGTDYFTSNSSGSSKSITIPSGQTSVSVPIATPIEESSTAKPQRNITLTILSGSGYSNGPAPSTLSIPAYNPAALSVVASNAGTISPGTNGSFTISRPANSDTTKALIVNYALSGTAQFGGDYSSPTTLSGAATIPAGSISVQVAVVAPEQAGSAAKAARNLSLTVNPGNSYVATNGSGNPIVGSLTFPAYNPAALSVSPSGSGAIGAGTSGGFTVSRPANSDTSKALNVNYTLGGVAAQGTDYSTPNGSASGVLTIPAGSTSANLPISVPTENGSVSKPSRNIDFKITAGSGYTQPSTGATPDTTLTIAAYDPDSVNLSVSGGGTIQPGSNGAFTVSRAANSNTTKALIVNYTFSGTAVAGDDYSTPGSSTGSVTIPAGQNSANIPVTVPVENGSTAKPSRSIALTLNSGNGYALSTPAPNGSLTIPAYDPASLGVATSDGGVIQPGTSGSFTIARPSTSDTTKPLIVNYALGGTAQAGTDYSTVGSSTGSVTIAAGQTSTSVPIAVPDENGSTAKAARSISLTVSAGSGYSLGSPAPTGTLTIPAYDPASLSVAVSNGGNIQPGTNGAFTIARPANSDTTKPLIVNYDFSGTAVAGSDYSTTGSTTGSVTIPVGQTSIAISVTVPTENGSAAKPSRNISLTLSSGNGYSLSNPAPTETLTIPAYDPASLSITSSNNGAIASGSNGSFTISRPANNDLSKPITVNYTFGGDAQPGTDYSLNGGTQGSVTIPANQTSVSIPVSATERNGQTAIPARTIELALESGSGYALSSPVPSSSLTIPVYDPASLTVQASGGGIVQPGTIGFFTVNRPSGDLSKPLTVNYQLGGTAQAGTDYQSSNGTTGSITIPAGQTSSQVSLSVPNENGSVAKSSRSIDFNLIPGNGYTLPANTGADAALSIPAYDPASLSITPSSGGIINRGSTGNFTVSRPANSDISVPLSVNYMLSGDAIDGSDYSQINGGGSLLIPAGKTSANLAVSVPSENGSTALPQKQIVFSVNPGNGYALSNPAPSSILTILAYDPASLSITPSGSGTINRGTSGSFTINRPSTAASDRALTVNFHFSGNAQAGTDYSTPSGGAGSIVIPANQQSVTVPVSVPAESGSNALPSKTLALNLDPGNGYTSTTASSDLTIPAYQPNLAALSVDGGNSTLTPGGTGDRMRFSRTGGDSSRALTVNLAVGGTAQPGVDYGQLPSSITIPAGQNFIELPIRLFPHSGSTAQAEKNLTIALAPGDGYDANSMQPLSYTIPAYNPPTQSSAVTLSIPAGGNSILQPGQATSGFSLTRASSDNSQPLTVHYSVQGSATAGTDYEALPGTATIPAGSDSVSVAIAIPSTASDASDGKTVAVVLDSGNDYQAGTNTQVTFTIASKAPQVVTRTVIEQVPVPTPAPTPAPTPTPVTLRSSLDLSRPNAPAFVISSDRPVDHDMNLSYEIGGNAQRGKDYMPFTGQVVLRAGQTQARVPIAVVLGASRSRSITASFNDPSSNAHFRNRLVSYNIGQGQASPPHSTAVTIVPPQSTGSGSNNSTLGAVGTVAGLGALASGISLATGNSGGFCAVPINPSDAVISAANNRPNAAQSPLSQATWGALNFSNLAAINGRPADQSLKLSDLHGIEALTFGDLKRFANVDMGTYTLSSLLHATTLKDLANSIYKSVSAIGDVPGLAEALATPSGLSESDLSAMSLDDLLTQKPELATLDWGSMSLSQVPGFLSTVKIGDIPDWQSLAIAQIPGLNAVTFAQIFPCFELPNEPNPSTENTLHLVADILFPQHDADAAYRLGAG